MVPFVYFLFRATLGTICLWAAVAKAKNLRAFTIGLRRYKLMPDQWAYPMALLIVASEMVVGTILITDIAPLAGAVGAVALFGTFNAVSALNLVRGNVVPCNCFGASTEELISKVAVGRATVLVALSTATLGLAFRHPPPLALGDIWPAATIVAPAVVLLRLADHRHFSGRFS